MSWFVNFAQAFWSYVAVSAPYLLIGFVVAGFVHVLFPIKKIKEWLGEEGLGSVFRAAFIGIPLPLCSCSVIPTAVTLKKSGAGNGATSSFLIATPESGIDSIAMTYSMMDFPMTVIRPIAAFVTAIIAGVLHILFNAAEADEVSEEKKASCCHKKEAKDKQPIQRALNFAFKELVEDLAFWMLVGLVSGALITVLVPNDFFTNLPRGYSMIGILLVGIPFYICASASTPIAASLMMKGLGPGAALLFLLVGPATNISNIFVLQKYIGKKGIFINIFAIVITGLIFAYSTEFFYEVIFKSEPLIKMNSHHHEHLSWWNHALGLFLMILLARGIWVEEIKPKFFSRKIKHCH